MKIWHSLAQANHELLSKKTNSTVTIGNFDGVHRGHQAIIGRTIQLAKQISGQAVVVSFTNHTEKFLGEQPGLLNQPVIRRELMAQLGLDALLEIKFDEHFAALTPEDFFQIWLVEGLQAHAVVVGHDFRFGAGARGDFQLLQILNVDNRMSIEQMPAVAENGEIISSSRIRQLIAAGSIEIANKMLGYPFEIEGIVVKGEQRGRTLGFPTANIHLGPEFLLPAYGVYLVDFTVDGVLYNGIANVGVKPTFGVYSPLIETYLLDTNIDLYQKNARIRFLRFIRPEIRFSDSEALKKQMIKDVQAGRRYLMKGLSQK
jgi:riboflavin kinase/FMN adenylyltransferase